MPPAIKVTKKASKLKGQIASGGPSDTFMAVWGHVIKALYAPNQLCVVKKRVWRIRNFKFKFKSYIAFLRLPSIESHM